MNTAKMQTTIVFYACHMNYSFLC